MTTRDTQANNPSYVTAEGLERMEEELEELRTAGRAQVADLIQKAKELGDISDSAQYDAAKEAQAFLEGKIRQIEDTVTRAVVIEAEGSTGGAVRIGSSVTLKDDEGIEETWSIVGRAEADTPKGRISNESPVGKSLLGRKGGETVDVETPVGVMKYSIVSVD
jgi:transcription elongation factor GreA